MIKLQDNNQVVLEAFEQFYQSTFKPNLKYICEQHLHVDYSSFINWRKQKKRFSDETLLKIINFINEHSQSA